MTDPSPAGIPDPRAGTAAIRRFGFMQDKDVHNNKPGPRRGGDDEATQHKWAALDYDGRGGRALDEDAAAREETAAEEGAVAAGEMAGIEASILRRSSGRGGGGGSAMWWRRGRQRRGRRYVSRRRLSWTTVRAAACGDAAAATGALIQCPWWGRR